MADRTTARPGTGRAMPARAETRIAEAGRDFARLDQVTSNPRLRAYHEAAGYEAVGERTKRSVRVRESAVYAVTLMRKRLGRT